MGKRKKSDKSSLGRDPFEDMNGMDWEEDELLPEPEQEETEGPERPETEPVEATTDLQPEISDLKSEEPEQAVAEAEPPTEEAKTEPAEAAPDLKSEEPVLSEDKGPAPEQIVAEAEPPTEEAETEPVEVVAEPDEEASRLLDELMDTIDQEVEEAFGPGAMADLAPAEAVGAGEEEQHVIFTLADTEYAVSIANVTEIGRPLDVTPVPNVPDWVLGVVNLRGDVISMVDLRAFLGMEWIGYQQTSRMLVAQARQEEMTTGLIVDRVNEIRYLAVDRIGAPTAAIEDQVAPYLRGVYEHDGRLLVVLDFDRLLLSPEMRQFEPV